MGALKNPEPEIVTVAAKKIIGRSLPMSMAENRSQELWQSFRPRVHEIPNRIDANFISVQVYDNPDFFSRFDMARQFARWAAVEVHTFGLIPAEMEQRILPGGLYARFDYRGRPMDFAPVARHIFGTWFPASKYALDDREHFEILGPNYRPDDPDAEETIWIPVRSV